jgi:flagellar biosynthesis anti-sigma factor FlgM
LRCRSVGSHCCRTIVIGLALAVARLLFQPQRDTKTVSEARYDDVLAEVNAKTEEFAVQTVASAPNVRKAKVEAIAEAIRKGAYKVDYEAVAERLLASGVLDDKD